MRNLNRVDIYVIPRVKAKIRRKANKLGISVSSLMVRAALEYNVNNEVNKNDEKQEKPRLFQLWDKIVNGTEEENKKQKEEVKK